MTRFEDLIERLEICGLEYRAAIAARNDKAMGKWGEQIVNIYRAIAHLLEHRGK